MVEEERCCIG